VTFRNALSLAALSLIGLVLVARTQAREDDKKAKISGTIECKAQASFGADAVARVTLLDVSLADAPAKKVGEQVVKDLKQFPIPFEVEYDPTALEKGHTYAIQVRIETNSRLDYINDTRVEVLRGGQPSKDVKVPVQPVKK
jgi:putative lipoprotein